MIKWMRRNKWNELPGHSFMLFSYHKAQPKQ
jgi:hypothetical protein